MVDNVYILGFFDVDGIICIWVNKVFKEDLIKSGVFGKIDCLKKVCGSY